eukprot:gnl/TRDRNA2_/TRDRNA2_175500_c0_seq3.p1 gnl/TRDRNA2_/TRDRNA2_175500_c0~~gnl/TRDRNA2_/TRDRNA2_175500_c0_seq3.p1  ORF type:complete len:154 (+),score=48.45 gnl/TRDRNA2_/TRDRNA2_175500_c0_seq3:224-685(+)
MHRNITIQELHDRFPNMGDVQIQTLVTACRTEIDLASMKFMDMKDSMKMMMAVKLAVDKVSTEINEIQFQKTKEALDPHGFKQKLSAADLQCLNDISEQMAENNHAMLNLQWQLQQLQWQWDTIEAVHGADPQFNSPKEMGNTAINPNEATVL